MLKPIKLFLVFCLTLSFFNPAFADDVTLDVPNLKQAVPNIYTGGQPSLQDIKSLKEKGFTLVVNLRGAGEFDDFNEGDEVNAAGVTYLSIPFERMVGLTKENAAKFHAALEANKAANNGKGGKTLLHCTIGMRAGGMLGLHEYLYTGLSKEEAIQLAVDANTERNRKYVTREYEKVSK